MNKINRMIKVFFYLILRRQKGWFDYILCTISYLLKTDKVYGKPMVITIEPVNYCDQKCPVCETGAGILCRPKEAMTLDKFKIIVDQVYKYTNSMMFYFMGEPFLNKDAYEMIKYAKSKKIYVETCTNSNFTDPQLLVESGIDEVHFQLGGMTQETHSFYRIGGNIDKAMLNIKETLRIRNSLGKKRPKVVIGFIVMQHNEHEIEEVKKLALSLGVDDIHIINPEVRDIEQGKTYLPKNKSYWIYDEKEFYDGKLVPIGKLNNKCSWIYYSATIQVNGNVVVCCRDPKGKHIMGNIFKEDLTVIWNNEKFRKFRRMINKDQKNVDLCKLCSGFGVPRLKADQKNEN